jgi:hypothetical protein
MNIQPTLLELTDRPERLAMVPVKLRRGKQTMLLFVGPLPRQLCSLLKGAGFLVGSAFSGELLGGAPGIDQLDYLFWGGSADPSNLIAMSVRDCRRCGWSVVTHSRHLPKGLVPASIFDGGIGE